MWFIAMLLFFVLTFASSNEVNADDINKMYDDNQAITLVANIEALYQSVVEYGGKVDVEQLGGEVSPIEVVIPSGVNVRTLDANARAINGFSRTAEVVGQFDAPANTVFGRIRPGVWLVVVDGDGQQGAVHSALVTEQDSTPVTPEELTGTPVWTLEVGGIPTPPPVTATPEGNNTGSGGDGDDDEDQPQILPSPAPEPNLEVAEVVPGTQTPDGNVEVLEMPEAPNEMTFQQPYWDTNANAIAYLNPETIAVNQDQLLPIPFGFLEGDEAEVLDILRSGDDSLYVNGAPYNYEGNVKAVPLSGIVLSVDVEPGVPNGCNITMRTQTPRGTWFTFRVLIQNDIRSFAVDDTLASASPEPTSSIDLRVACSEDSLQTRGARIVPGDHIVIRTEIADHFDPEDAGSLIPRSIERRFGINGGLQPYMRAIDRGQLDPDTSVLTGRAALDHIVITHTD